MDLKKDQIDMVMIYFYTIPELGIKFVQKQPAQFQQEQAEGVMITH